MQLSCCSTCSIAQVELRDKKGSQISSNGFIVSLISTVLGCFVQTKEGGLQQAEKDFNDIVVQGSARPIATGKVGKTADGKTVYVRNKSSDGRPTLEVKNVGLVAWNSSCTSTKGVRSCKHYDR